MTTVLVTKASSRGWQQIRVPSFNVVRLLANGYHLVRYSAIITKDQHASYPSAN